MSPSIRALGLKRSDSKWSLMKSVWDNREIIRKRKHDPWTRRQE